MRTLRVALVQFEARDDVDDNIARAAALAGPGGRRRGPGGAPRVRPVPRLRGRLPGVRPAGPGTDDGPVRGDRPRARLLDPRRQPRGGSADPARPSNTAVLIDRDGRIAATYRKLHLFDVAVDDGPADTESARVTPGDRAVVADVDGVGLGLSICYDLRFPELYRALSLAGASVLAVPGGVHRAHRPRPLGGAAAGAGDRERGVGDRRGGLRRRRTRRHPGLGPLDGRGSRGGASWPRRPIGARRSSGRRWTSMRRTAARRQIPVLANRRPDALPPERDVLRIESGRTVPAER